jgi:hypothetical protein
MPQVWPHRRGQREVFRRGSRVTAPGQGKAEAEVRVVVTRACLHDPPEAVRRLLVPAGVELRPAESLQDAARPWLSLRGPFEKLGGGRRAPPAEQVEAPTVPRVTVASWGLLRRGCTLIFAGSGIVIAVRCF